MSVEDALNQLEAEIARPAIGMPLDAFDKLVTSMCAAQAVDALRHNGHLAQRIAKVCSEASHQCASQQATSWFARSSSNTTIASMIMALLHFLSTTDSALQALTNATLLIASVHEAIPAALQDELAALCDGEQEQVAQSPLHAVAQEVESFLAHAILRSAAGWKDAMQKLASSVPVLPAHWQPVSAAMDLLPAPAPSPRLACTVEGMCAVLTALLAVHDAGTLRGEVLCKIPEAASTAHNFVWTALGKLQALAVQDLATSSSLGAALRSPAAPFLKSFAGETTMGAAILLRAAHSMQSACGRLHAVTWSAEADGAGVGPAHATRDAVQALTSAVFPFAKLQSADANERLCRLTSTFNSEASLSSVVPAAFFTETARSAPAGFAAGPVSAREWTSPSPSAQLAKLLRAPRFWAGKMDNSIAMCPSVLDDPVVAPFLISALCAAGSLCCSPLWLPAETARLQLNGQQGTLDFAIGPSKQQTDLVEKLIPALHQVCSYVPASATCLPTFFRSCATLMLQSEPGGLSGASVFRPVGQLVIMQALLQQTIRNEIRDAPKVELVSMLLQSFLSTTLPTLDEGTALLAAAQRHAADTYAVTARALMPAVHVFGSLKLANRLTVAPAEYVMVSLHSEFIKAVTVVCSESRFDSPNLASAMAMLWLTENTRATQLGYDMLAALDNSVAQAQSLGEAAPSVLASNVADLHTSAAHLLLQIVLQPGNSRELDLAAGGLVAVLCTSSCPAMVCNCVWEALLPVLSQVDAVEGVGLSPAAIQLFASNAHTRPLQAVLRACARATHALPVLSVMSSRISGPVDVLGWLANAVYQAATTASSILGVCFLPSRTKDVGRVYNPSSMQLYGPLLAETLSFIGDALMALPPQAVGRAGNMGGGAGEQALRGLPTSLWQNKGVVVNALASLQSLISPTLSRDLSRTLGPHVSQGHGGGTPDAEAVSVDVSSRALEALVNSGSVLPLLCGVAQIFTALAAEPSCFSSTAVVFGLSALPTVVTLQPGLLRVKPAASADDILAKTPVVQWPAGVREGPSTVTACAVAVLFSIHTVYARRPEPMARTVLLRRSHVAVEAAVQMAALYAQGEGGHVHAALLSRTVAEVLPAASSAWSALSVSPPAQPHTALQCVERNSLEQGCKPEVACTWLGLLAGAYGEFFSRLQLPTHVRVAVLEQIAAKVRAALQAGDMKAVIFHPAVEAELIKLAESMGVTGPVL